MHKVIRRKIALRSLEHVCTFIGATALFSYFWNFTLDLRHWYVTLGSAVVCAVLWAGFYVVETHREAVIQAAPGLMRFVLGCVPRLRTKREELDTMEAEEKAT